MNKWLIIQQEMNRQLNVELMLNHRIYIDSMTHFSLDLLFKNKIF